MVHGETPCMTFDVGSLLLALVINVITVAVVLVTVMGKVNLAGRRAQQGVSLQALGWMSMLGSEVWPGTWLDHLLSTVSVACISGGLVCMREAFARWSGHGGRHRLHWGLAGATVLGYTLGFAHYPFRVGWSNAGLALLTMTVVQVMVREPRLPVGPWRWLVAGVLTAQAVVTAWRGALGAFDTAAYPSYLSPHPVNTAAALVSNVSALLVLMGILLAMREEASRELQRLATQDGLTGLLNRRAWMERAQAALALSARHQQPLVVMMLDLDHFKRINDAHGHAVGDRALQVAAQALMEVLRADDIAGRFGGEEFCVLLRHADAASAQAVDQRMRDRLQALVSKHLTVGLNYSAGLVVYEPGATATLEGLLHQADVALYAAKAQGRGRTVLSPVSGQVAQAATDAAQ